MYLKDEILFTLKNPGQEKSPYFGKLNKINFGIFGKTMLIFIVLLILSNAIVGSVSLFMKLHNIYPIDNSSSANLRDTYGKYAFLVVGLLTPLMEECMFRLPLSFKKSHLIVSVVIIGAVLGRLLFDNTALFITCIVVFALLIVFIGCIRNESLKRTHIKYGKYFVLASILIFTFLHIFNYENIKVLPLCFIFLLPIMLMGIFISYLRLKVGIVYALFTHALFNSIAILLL